jgi:hypothetical protein
MKLAARPSDTETVVKRASRPGNNHTKSQPVSVGVLTSCTAGSPEAARSTTGAPMSIQFESLVPNGVVHVRPDQIANL